MPPELTKKEQKAAAFKAGKNGIKTKKPAPEEPLDLPEQDPIQDDNQEEVGVVNGDSNDGEANADDMKSGSAVGVKKEKSKSKKLKEKKFKERLEREKKEGKPEKAEKEAKVVETTKVDKGKQKEEISKVNEDATGEEEAAEGTVKKTRKGIKQKFILFVGESATACLHFELLSCLAISIHRSTQLHYHERTYRPSLRIRMR